MCDYLSRKERIAITAIEIVYEVGFQGLTTREIASREGITEAALYRHYRNRSDIVAAVVDHFAKFDHSIAESVRELDMSAIDGIAYMIERLAEYYEGYPAVASVMNVFGWLKTEEGLAERFGGILADRKDSIARLLLAAQSEGSVRADIDAVALSNAILGSFSIQVYEWLLNGSPPSLKRGLTASVGMLLQLAKP